MKFNELLNIIQSATFEQRQSFIDLLYSPKIFTDNEKLIIEADNLKNKLVVLKKMLQKQNLKVPKEISKGSISLVMNDFLTNEEKNEYNMLIETGNYIDISIYFLNSSI